LQQLRRRHPESRFVISTTTATGMQLAREKYPQYCCFYFPIDFSWAIRNALRRVSPDVIVLTELEVWPNLVDISHDQGIPVVVINGRLSEKSFAGYVKRQKLVRPFFRKIHQVIAQSNEYGRRFVQLGCQAEQVHVAGSIKFDGALQTPPRDQVDALRQSLQLAATDSLWVAGSTQEPEEQIVARLWHQLRKQHPHLRLVIVPRHPHRGECIRETLTKSGVPARLKSRSGHLPIGPGEILIADTIGELKAWWSLANIAFVGGSFGNRGGQNMLEPAACGAAVCFGPNTWNFRQMVSLLLSQDAAIQVDSESELRDFVEQCLADPQAARSRGHRAQDLVKSSQGAVTRTCDLLQRYFPMPGLPTANQPSKAA